MLEVGYKDYSWMGEEGEKRILLTVHTQILIYSDTYLLSYSRTTLLVV